MARPTLYRSLRGRVTVAALLATDVFLRPPQKPTDLVVDVTIANRAVVDRRE